MVRRWCDDEEHAEVLSNGVLDEVQDVQVLVRGGVQMVQGAMVQVLTSVGV